MAAFPEFGSPILPSVVECCCFADPKLGWFRVLIVGFFRTNTLTHKCKMHSWSLHMAIGSLDRMCLLFSVSLHLSPSGLRCFKAVHRLIAFQREPGSARALSCYFIIPFWVLPWLLFPDDHWIESCIARYSCIWRPVYTVVVFAFL